MSKSSDIVAIVCERVHVPTQPAFEHVFWLNLHPLRTFAHFVSNLSAVVTDVVLRVTLRKLFK
jgi:hypothetical protein